MQTHFGEEFRLLRRASSRRGATSRRENVWRQFDQVVCPVDLIKPFERRRGWSARDWNAQPGTLGDLIDAGGIDYL
jgi:hypothetical protein